MKIKVYDHAFRGAGGCQIVEHPTELEQAVGALVRGFRLWAYDLATAWKMTLDAFQPPAWLVAKDEAPAALEADR